MWQWTQWHLKGAIKPRQGDLWFVCVHELFVCCCLGRMWEGSPLWGDLLILLPSSAIVMFWPACECVLNWFWTLSLFVLCALCKCVCAVSIYCLCWQRHFCSSDTWCLSPSLYVSESHSQQAFLVLSYMIKMYNIDKAFNMLIMQK